MITDRIYSIGYATKPIATFLEQLHQYRIDAIADVRSVPYSKIFHDYHREPLAATLKKSNIHYVYLGEELGPRSKESQHYDQFGQVQFIKLMESKLFLCGIDRLQKGLEKGMHIALMCAEKDPADCHRSLLIAYYLQRECNIEVQHIKHNGDLESQTELEKRLMQMHGFDQDLFASHDQQLEKAWELQSRLKAYKKPNEQAE